MFSFFAVFVRQLDVFPAALSTFQIYPETTDRIVLFFLGFPHTHLYNLFILGVLAGYPLRGRSAIKLHNHNVGPVIIVTMETQCFHLSQFCSQSMYRAIAAPDWS